MDRLVADVVLKLVECDDWKPRASRLGQDAFAMIVGDIDSRLIEIDETPAGEASRNGGGIAPEGPTDAGETPAPGRPA